MKLVFVPLKDVFKECKGKRQFSIKKDAYRRFSSVSNEMQIGIKKIAALYEYDLCSSLLKILNHKHLILIVVAVPVFMNMVSQPTGNVSAVVGNRLPVKDHQHSLKVC